MPARRHETDADALKSIYRDLAEGRITEEAAQSAETAIHARRAGGDRMFFAAPPTSRPATGRRKRGKRREKMFGLGRPRPMDGNVKTRIMHLALCLSRRTEKGKHYGVLTAKFVKVLKALLFEFHNAKSGLCFPSYERIAEKADCAVSTVGEAIKALEAAALLTWVNRLKRIREPTLGLPGIGATRLRVFRTSNAYAFNDPNSPKTDFPGGTTNQVSIPLLETAAATAKRLGERLVGSLSGLQDAVRGRQPAT